MINSIGSFAVFFIIFWFLSASGFALLYRFAKPWIMRAPAKKGIYLFLLWWSGPPLITLFVSSLLFLPGVRSFLVTGHCHNNCDASRVENHAPMLHNTTLETVGIVLLICIVGYITFKIAKHVLGTVNLRLLLQKVASRSSDLCVVDTPKPMIFTIGWLKPVTCISQGLLNNASGDDLAVALTHEKTHQARKHNLIMLLGNTLTALLLPSVSKQLRRHLRLLTELACDDEAVKSYGKIQVAEAIVHIHKLAGNLSSVALETRVQRLLQNEPTISVNLSYVYTAVLSIAIGLVLAIEPLHYLYEWFIRG